jgi:hypothetical protein
MRTRPVSASKAAVDLNSAADLEIHNDAVDKLVLSDEDVVNSGAATQPQQISDSTKDSASSVDGSSHVVPALNLFAADSSEQRSGESARQRDRAVQFPTPPQLPTPSPDFSQSMLLRSRLADAGAISALSTALKLTISVDKKDTSQELSRALEFLQERAAAALASMCKSSRVCRLYINNAAAVDLCSNVMLKTRRDTTLHALVLVLSCMFGAVSHTDSWW